MYRPDIAQERYSCHQCTDYQPTAAAQKQSAHCLRHVITGSIACNTKWRYISYLEGDFQVFCPETRHVALMGVKFGMEEWTKGPLLHAKFYPHQCNDKGIGPPKLTFLLRFHQNSEYKRPQGRILCAIFTKFAAFVPRFRMR